MKRMLSVVSIISMLSIFCLLTACGGSSTPATVVTVQSWSKSSVATVTDGGGAITFMFVFATSPSSAPTLTVTLLSDSSEISSAECTEDTADTTGMTYNCAVTGLQGCATLEDYTASLTGGGLAEAYEVIFNSADDEFDQDLTDTCWSVTNPGSTTEISAASGKLVMSQTTISDEFDPYAFLTKTVTGSFSTSTQIATLTYSGLSDTGVSVTFAAMGQTTGLDEGDYFGFTMGSLESRETWLIGDINGVVTVPSEGGDWATYLLQIVTPIAACSVNNRSVLSYFMNFDETPSSSSTYEQATPANMACAPDSEGCTITDVFPTYDVSSSWDQVIPFLALFHYQQPVGSNLTATYDYVRFRSSNIDGTVSNCPVIQ